MYREGLTGKFSPNRFLKTRFFLEGFLLFSVIMYFQAFKKHKLHEVLHDPGSADVTANVDFAYLRSVTRGKGWHLFFSLSFIFSIRWIFQIYASLITNTVKNETDSF